MDLPVGIVHQCHQVRPARANEATHREARDQRDGNEDATDDGGAVLSYGGTDAHAHLLAGRVVQNWLGRARIVG